MSERKYNLYYFHTEKYSHVQFSRKTQIKFVQDFGKDQLFGRECNSDYVDMLTPTDAIMNIFIKTFFLK